MNKENNQIFKINTRIIITVILLLVVVISSTFAWFSFSSKKTSLVLTIGDIDSTQITLYPYEFSGTLNPVDSYEDPGVSYTQVTAINNNTSSSSFDLTYNADTIPEELRSSAVKYTITKSTSKDTGYEFYDDGNLSALDPETPIILLEGENIDPNTTLYYRVYLWLDNNAGDTSNLQGKTLSINLNAKLNGVDTSGSPDLQYTVVNLSNSNSNTLDSSKVYDLTSYSCQNGTTISFNKTTRRITTNGIDKCTLNFTETTGDLLYNVVEIGDYISYTGDNGCTGNKCQGWNASQSNTDIYDNYGYCSSTDYKFYTYGWRVLYKNDNSVYIVSAGAPECVSGTSGNSESTKTSLLNASKKYCNKNYISGGVCDDKDDTLVHAFNGDDFYKFTSQYYGNDNARYLYSYNDGGTYDSTGTKICYNTSSQTYCGYNNSLIDNGGYYWFASGHSSTRTLYWNPGYRRVDYNSYNNPFGLRPVLKLDSTIRTTGGLGTIENPYTISTRSNS